MYICHYLFYTDPAVTLEYLLYVHSCTKCKVTCYAQHVSWPACISRLLGSPNSWAVCALHISYVIWVSQFSLATESFVFVASTVHHFLYPLVPCHPTQHLITEHACTHALGSFCGHTVCLTYLVPPILSSSLSTHFWYPVCPPGYSVTLAWVHARPIILHQPLFTSILPSIITEHMQSTGPCISHHGRCKNIYTIHRTCLTLFAIWTSVF